jgi:hypothetical protein
MPRISYSALGVAPRSLGLPLMKPIVPRQALAEEVRPPVPPRSIPEPAGPMPEPAGPMPEPAGPMPDRPAPAPPGRLRRPTTAQAMTDELRPPLTALTSSPPQAPTDWVPGPPADPENSSPKPGPAAASAGAREKTGKKVAEAGNQRKVSRDPPRSHPRSHASVAATPEPAAPPEARSQSGLVGPFFLNSSTIEGETAVVAPVRRPPTEDSVPHRQSSNQPGPAGRWLAHRGAAARDPHRVEVRIGTIEIRSPPPPPPPPPLRPGSSPNTAGPHAEATPKRLTRGYAWVRSIGLS